MDYLLILGHESNLSKIILLIQVSQVGNFDKFDCIPWYFSKTRPRILYFIFYIYIYILLHRWVGISSSLD